MGTCCVCWKKTGFFSNNGVLKVGLEVCEECWKNKQRLVINKNSSEEDIRKARISRQYFEQHLNSGRLTNEVQEIIKELLDESVQSEASYMDYTNRKTTFMTTTGYNFEGHAIKEYLNIVNGEIVLGTGFLSELSASVTDFLGTTSDTIQGKIGKAKTMALENMIQSALGLGANAIIGIDFDITTLSNNIIAVSANGTAVVIEKV